MTEEYYEMMGWDESEPEPYSAEDLEELFYIYSLERQEEGE